MALIDEAVIYNRAITVDEISKTYQEGLGWIGLWHMDGDWTDASGNGRNGTAYNGSRSSASTRGWGARPGASTERMITLRQQQLYHDDDKHIQHRDMGLSGRRAGHRLRKAIPARRERAASVMPLDRPTPGVMPGPGYRWGPTASACLSMGTITFRRFLFTMFR